MQVTVIIYGPPKREERVPRPDWETIESQLRALDGEELDSVILESIGDNYMGISGGRENRYVVGGSLADFGSFILADGESGRGTLDVVVAGDYNRYESRNVVGLETVITVAKSFFQTGRLAESSNWQQWQPS